MSLVVQCWCLVLLFSLSLAAGSFTVTDRNVTTGSDTAVTKVLANTGTGENVSLVLNMGGRVESLFLVQPSNGIMYDVLMNNGNNATAMLQPSGFRGLMLLPYANRIANHTYVWNNTRYYLPVNEPARNNSIHGLLYNRTMSVAYQHASESAAVVGLEYQFGSDTGYPFPLHVLFEYSLTAAGLSITLTATNRDPSWPLPFYSSWHSYFNVQDVSTSVLQLDNCTTWAHVMVGNNSNLYSQLIPTGETDKWTVWDGSQPIGGSSSVPTYYDDEVKSKTPCAPGHVFQTRITDGDINAVLWADSSYRYIQVFTGAEKLFHQSAVAIEVMNGKCDCFNNGDGLHELSGGESYVGMFGVNLE